MWKTRVRGEDVWNKKWEAETPEEAAELAAEEANRASSVIDDDQDIEVQRADLPGAPVLTFSVGAEVRVVHTARTFNSPKGSVSPKGSALSSRNKEPLAPSSPPDPNSVGSEFTQTTPASELSDQKDELASSKTGKKGGKAETSKASATDFIDEKSGR